MYVQCILVHDAWLLNGLVNYKDVVSDAHKYM